MESSLSSLLMNYNVIPLLRSKSINKTSINSIKSTNVASSIKNIFPNYTLDDSVKEAILKQPNGELFYYIIPHILDTSSYDLVVSNKNTTLCFSMIDFDINFFNESFDFIFSVASGGHLTSPFTRFESDDKNNLNIISTLKNYNDNTLKYKHSQINNKYTFISSGRNKLLSLEVFENSIVIKIGNSIFNKITLDKNFNLEKVEISKINLKKLNISNKYIHSNNYNEVIKNLEEYVNILNLETDKKIKIMNESEFYELINYSKLFLEKSDFIKSKKFFDIVKQIKPRILKMSQLVDIENLDFTSKINSIEMFIKYEKENGALINKIGFINNIKKLYKLSLSLKNFNILEK